MEIRSLIITAVLATAILFSGVATSAQTTNNSALIAQLQAQIQSLMQQILALQTQKNGTQQWCYTFNTNLGFSQSGSSDVGSLHAILDKQGFSYTPDTGNTYDEGTAHAVIQFQSKYKILQTGYVGALTKAKLNSLYGCSTTSTTPHIGSIKSALNPPVNSSGTTTEYFIQGTGLTADSHIYLNGSMIEGDSAPSNGNTQLAFETSLPADTYPVYILNASGQSNTVTLTITTSTPTPTPNPTSPTTISSCQDISKPGNYTLSGDIINSANIPCINVHDTNNVNLDCQNHSVMSNGQNYAIYFNNVNNFSVNNCTAKPVDNHTSATQMPIMLSNSSNGVLSNLNVSAGPADMMEISNSTKITVSGSTFTGLEYLIYQSSFINTKNNTFTATTAQGGVVASLQGGSNNSVVNNNIDGMSDGIFHGYGQTDNIGVDDDIVITDEKSDLISGNNLKNNWDCGIETGGYMYDTQIINNKIDNDGICAIGGWYYASMKGNTISGNTVTNSPELFLFFRDYDLRPSVEPVMYFENNNFISNTLTSQKTSARGSTSINIFAPSGRGGGSQFPDFTDQQIIASNNVIKNNNFGTLFSASFAPSNIFVDGGGNTCLPTSDTDYPINCGGTAPTTPINGACGSASGVTTSTTPSTGLCASGATSIVSNNVGLGFWMWSCASSNGGTTTSCNAPIASTSISGACGSAQGQTIIPKPTANLCATGTPINVVDNTGLEIWMWGCQGANGGTTANCYANDGSGSALNGSCGSASGVSSSTIPVDNLCSSGTPTSVSNNSGLGFWMWGCQGAGMPTSCNAPIANN